MSARELSFKEFNAHDPTSTAKRESAAASRNSGKQYLGKVGKLMLETVLSELKRDAHNLRNVRMVPQSRRKTYPAEPVVAQDERLAEPPKRVGQTKYVNRVLGVRALRICSARIVSQHTQIFCGVKSQFSA